MVEARIERLQTDLSVLERVDEVRSNGHIPHIGDIRRRFQAETVKFPKEEVVDPLEVDAAVEVPHEVLGKAIDGELDAMSTIFETYNSRIVGYCARRVFYDDAEDCSQEVWYKAVRAMGDYEFTGTPLSSWLYTIAKNTCFDHNKRAQLQRQIIQHSNLIGIPLDEQCDPLERARDLRVDVNPENKLEKDYDSQVIEALILQLPTEQQIVVTLRYRMQKTIAETVALTGKSEGTVKALAHKGIKGMKKRAESVGVI